MSRFAARLVRRRLRSPRPSCVAGMIVRPVLLSLVVASTLVLDVSAASASGCPTEIDSAIRVSELGSAEEIAPSELDRSFPDVPERLAPGSGGGDRLQIHSIADVPVDASLRVDDAKSPVGGDGDLHVTITWNEDTVAEGSYGDVVGESYEIARLAPDGEATLGVEVELPAVDEWDNRTQNRTWPLQFSLGIGAECGGGSDDGADASSGADASGRAEASGKSDDRGDAAGEDAHRTADSQGDRDDSAAAADQGDDASSGTNEVDSSGAGSADDGTAEAGPNLPRTGFDSAGIIVLASAALGFGAVLLAASRRRRSGGDQ